MNIKERMVRSDPGDVIHIGEVVENHFFNTELHDILHAITQGRIMREATENKNGTPADRILGRMEMAANLVKDLEQCVIDKQNLQAPIKRHRRGKPSPLAQEPEVPEELSKYGGQV